MAPAAIVEIRFQRIMSIVPQTTIPINCCVRQLSFALPARKLSKLSLRCSAGFPTCRIADFLVGRACMLPDRLNISSVRRLENLRYGRLESLRYENSARVDVRASHGSSVDIEKNAGALKLTKG